LRVLAMEGRSHDVHLLKTGLGCEMEEVLDRGGRCQSGWYVTWALRCDLGCRLAARSSAGAATTMGNWASATQTAAETRRARWQAPPSAGATLLCPDSDARMLHIHVRDGVADQGMCGSAGEPPLRGRRRDGCGDQSWGAFHLRASGRGWRVGEGLCGEAGLDLRDGSAQKGGGQAVLRSGLWSGVGDREPRCRVWASEAPSWSVGRTCRG